jgi:glycerate-2-kinase
LIGSVEKAVQRVKDYLEKENFTVEYFSNKITGEAKLFGEKLYNDYFLHLNTNQQQHKRLALIGTGELTVTIKGKGIGGRNQEMLLGFLECVKKKTIEKDFLILGANLDGIEGNSNALGALIDNSILKKVQELNIHTEKYLRNNDSNSFFRLVNADIISGPTGCNVNDIIFILYDNKEV